MIGTSPPARGPADRLGSADRPRQVRLSVRDIDDHGEITTGAVAGYLARYATRATEVTGHAAARITDDTTGIHADPATHVGRLVSACWRLGQPPTAVLVAQRMWTRCQGPDDVDPLAEWMAGYGRLCGWAHMLGFGGHFSQHAGPGNRARLGHPAAR